jgi:hypothetical protein
MPILARVLTCALVGLGLGTAARAADPAPAPAAAPEKVVFATNWKAQAAQGGFYQALGDGT